MTHKVCVRCEKRQPVRQYYKSANVLFKDGYAPVCKDCVTEVLDEHDFKGFQALLKLLDKPLLESLYDGKEGQYIAHINSLPQYRDMSYDDSDFFKHGGAVVNNEIIAEKLEVMTEEQIRELEYKWGKGFDEQDYIFLENEIRDYYSRYEVDSKTLEIIIQQLCLTQLSIRKLRERGQDVSKQMKTFQDLMSSAGLKPIQENAASGVSQETFGTLIEKFENESPIPEPAEAWRDVDGIGKYIRTWFLSQMSKSLGFKNQFQQEADEEIEKYTVYPEFSDDDE